MHNKWSTIKTDRACSLSEEEQEKRKEYLVKLKNLLKEGIKMCIPKDNMARALRKAQEECALEEEK